MTGENKNITSKISANFDFKLPSGLVYTIDKIVLKKNPTIRKMVRDFQNLRGKAGNRGYRKFFRISADRILVVDANGQSTKSGNTSKYDNKHKFNEGARNYIRDNFVKNWKWTEECYGITVTSIEMVPVKNKGQSFFGQTVSYIGLENIEGYDFENPDKDFNSLCKLNYKITGDKTAREQSLPEGFFSQWGRGMDGFTDFSGGQIVKALQHTPFNNFMHLILDEHIKENTFNRIH